MKLRKNNVIICIKNIFMEEMKMIDFTNCEINKYRYYGGKNGGKICIIYNGEEYMLKFPNINEK